MWGRGGGGGGASDRLRGLVGFEARGRRRSCSIIAIMSNMLVITNMLTGSRRGRERAGADIHGAHEGPTALQDAGKKYVLL